MIKTINSVGAIAAFMLCGFQNASAATINEVFTESYQCNSVNLRAQSGITQQQLRSSCDEISETETDFYSFFNTNASSPLPNDNNTTLDVYIYLSSAEYKANGQAHFGINTDNGGMYLEGTPSNSANQAKFISHICEDSWVPFSCAYTGQVYNLQHEYVHYLDGRFNVSGPFGTFTYNAGLTEGLADFLANGTNYTRTLNSLSGKEIPPFYNILSADYNHPDLYQWGYMAIHYMNANHRSDYDDIINALRSGSTATYQTTLKNVSDRIGDGFSDYVQSLTSATAMSYVALPEDNNFGSCNLEQRYIRYVDDSSTSNLSVLNNTSVPLRLMWIDNVTGSAGTQEIALLTQGQQYNNSFWRENDRFVMMSENRECVGVGIVGQTASFSVEPSLVNNLVPDTLPAANEIGSCSLERPYFKTTNTTNVTVTNNSNEVMQVRWVNYVTGARSDTVYATLNVGESYTGTTWQAGDRMVFVDSLNSCKGVVSLTPGENVYSINGDVQNNAPTANINGTYNGVVNIAVNFTSAGSTDNDGSIEAFRWDFGDGAVSTLANPSHAYNSQGVYDVRLTVTDNEGATNTTSTKVTISAEDIIPGNTLPNICTTQAPITGGNLVAGNTVCLGNSPVIWLSIANISGHDSVKIRTSHGSGDLSINYDNSGWPTGTNSDDGFSNDIGNSECIYVSGGSNYWGNLKISNSNGTASILVEFDTPGCNVNENQNTPPTAYSNGSYLGTVNNSISFSSAGSSDTEGPIVSYSWNFGDGKISTLMNPSHTYTAVGDYNVELTVTDSDGATDTVVTTASISAELSGGDAVIDACAIESPISGWIEQSDDICVPSGSWVNAIAYYGINVPLGTNKVVIMTAHGSGNGNLYYKSSGWASGNSYDQRSDNPDNAEFITINNPRAGYHYFSIVGEHNGMSIKFDFE